MSTETLLMVLRLCFAALAIAFTIAGIACVVSAAVGAVAELFAPRSKGGRK